MVSTLATSEGLCTVDYLSWRYQSVIRSLEKEKGTNNKIVKLKKTLLWKFLGMNIQ